MTVPNLLEFTWGYDEDAERWMFIDISDDLTPLNSWQGYFIKGLKDNITLIRQN